MKIKSYYNTAIYLDSLIEEIRSNYIVKYVRTIYTICDFLTTICE